MAWISGNRYLSQSEMDNNALLTDDYLRGKESYSINAVSAILGNMQIESTINPAIWESLTVDYDRGYGLCQWTPATKLFNWLDSHGYGDRTNGDYQLEFLASGDDGYGGSAWGNSSDPNAPSSQPPISWQEFLISTLPVQTLTDYFMYYWEKPSYSESESSKQKRQEAAEYYYELLTGHTPEPPEPFIRTKAKWIFYMKRRRIL